jgi:hypothetical protein
VGGARFASSQSVQCDERHGPVCASPLFRLLMLYRWVHDESRAINMQIAPAVQSYIARQGRRWVAFLTSHLMFGTGLSPGHGEASASPCRTIAAAGRSQPCSGAPRCGRRSEIIGGARARKQCEGVEPTHEHARLGCGLVLSFLSRDLRLGKHPGDLRHACVSLIPRQAAMANVMRLARKGYPR